MGLGHRVQATAMSGDQRTSRKRQLVIALAEGKKSLLDWAQEKGVSMQRAYRWAKDPKVKAAGSAHCRAAVDQSLAVLSGQVAWAAEAIGDLCKNAASESVRLGALVAWAGGELELRAGLRPAVSRPVAAPPGFGRARHDRRAAGRRQMLVHPRCLRLKEAFQTYSRQRRGGEWINYPVDSHPEEDLIDALRGGIRDAYRMAWRRGPVSRRSMLRRCWVEHPRIHGNSQDGGSGPGSPRDHFLVPPLVRTCHSIGDWKPDAHRHGTPKHAGVALKDLSIESSMTTELPVESAL